MKYSAEKMKAGSILQICRCSSNVANLANSYYWALRTESIPELKAQGEGIRRIAEIKERLLEEMERLSNELKKFEKGE